MTTCSSIAALGMMPLLLFIYSKVFSLTIGIPFDVIGITLAVTVPPVGIGIFLRYKFEKYSDILAKIFSTIGAIAIVVVAGISIWLYREMFRIIWQQLVLAAIFPLI